jgi:hypothetical protein
MAKQDINIMPYLFYLFILLVILAGVYVVSTYGSEAIFTTLFGKYDSTKTIIKNSAPSSDFSPNGAKYEMVDESTIDCPNVLIRRGNLLLLINTHRPPENGTNPIIFNHLDEYIHYVKVQRETHNNYCPVMFLQEESNAQGKNVYRVRPGPFDQQGGAPSPELSIDEIKGVHDFFRGAPGSETTFVDKRTTGPFNEDSSPGTIESGIVTTGHKFLSTSINTPTVSDNSKLTKVEHISTEKAMNLPITPTNETNQIPVYQNYNYSTPPPTLKYNFKESMTDVSVPITSSVQNITTLPPLTESSPPLTESSPPLTESYPPLTQSSPSSLPPLTTPPNTPVYQQPLQTQYFNGSLGPYNGTTTDTVPPTDSRKKTVKIVDNSRVNGPYNKGLYPGFDPYGEDNGQYTNIDQVHDSTMTESKISDNPMDPNWGGVLYTKQQVMSGKYNDNQVLKPIYGGAPNVMSIPSLMPNGGPPLYITPQTVDCPDLKNMKTRSLRSAPESA